MTSGFVRHYVPLTAVQRHQCCGARISDTHALVCAVSTVTVGAVTGNFTFCGVPSAFLCSVVVVTVGFISLAFLSCCTARAAVVSAAK